MTDQVDVQPQPMLAQMLQAMLELPPAPAPAEPRPVSGNPIVLFQPPPAPLTREQVYSQFRTDMRAAGLAVYELTEEMLGTLHEGPAVNVRDPVQATAVTSITLATMALAPGLWRMYPVEAPLDV